jgi:hypothetical protein
VRRRGRLATATAARQQRRDQEDRRHVQRQLADPGDRLRGDAQRRQAGQEEQEAALWPRHGGEA